MNRRFVRNLILIAYGLGSGFTAFGQDNDNDLNEGPDMMNARREWLFRQRAYPNGFIPSDARARAVIELNRQLAERSAARARRKTPEGLPNGATTGTWTLIGPNPTHNGILTTAAWTSALAVDPANASIAYLGAPEGGVWKTTDGGVHWTPLTDTQPSLAIASITIDPTNHLTVYVGTGDSYLYGEGLLKTTDGGNTWSYLASPFAGPFNSSGFFGGGAHINQIAVDPANPSVVLAAVWRFPASSAGIYRSADGGNTWAQVFPGAPATSIAFSATGSVAYAAISDYFGTSQAGIYKSTDAGQSWTAANGSGTAQLPLLAAGIPSVGEMQLAMAPSSPTTLYASIQGLSTFAPLTPNSIFKSIDGGVTWNPTPSPFAVQAAGNKGIVLTVHPTNPNIVFVGEQNLYRSLDGGQTWAVVTSSADAPVNNLFGDIRSFGFSAGGVVFYVGSDGGPSSTTDAANQSMNWTNLASTLATTQFYPGLSINPDNPAVAFAGSQDQGVQQYSGSLTWNTVQPCDGGWTAIDPIQTNNVYVVCETGTVQVLKSINGGSTFAAAQTGIVAADRVAFIPPMVLDPGNPQHLYFGTYRIYQTTNGAASWTPISGDLTTGTNSPTISTIAVAPSDSNRVYAGTSDGRVQTTSNAAAGASAIWTNITGTLPNRSVSQVVVDPSNASTAYAVMSGFTFGSDTQGHIFKTINAGATWVDISGNLPNVPADDLVVDPDVLNWLYVATDIGVYSTTNGGVSWVPFGNGLPRTVVSSLKLHHASRTLRAATMGRSAWDIIAPLPQPVLSISKTHSGNFAQGQQNVAYTITVSNALAGGPTSGTVTVVDTLPAGLTLVSIAGTGWICAVTTCTRSDVLRGGSSYPPIIVTVNVASNAVSPRINQASVSGGGSVSSNVSDSTTLVPAGTPPALNVTKTHSGNFGQGQQGATYTITVANSPTAGPTTGTVTVTDTIPSGLTLVSMAGTGWSCVSTTCTRSDVLNSAASYPIIIATVNVAANASSPQVNRAAVSGGGSPGANTSDLTSITILGTLSLNRPRLNVAYSGTLITSTQTVQVNFLNGVGANWTVSSSQPNITVFPASGSGNGSIQVTGAAGASGTITVTAAGSPGSPQQIQINVSSVTPALPFGSFDTPANNTTGIAGAIPVTGWALDNIEVSSVGIWREPVTGEAPQSNGLMFIGNAVFVADARPDVQVAFPSAPWNYRAGWGYMLLTNFLPHNGGSAGPGNGTFNLHALAVNKAGQTIDLGTRTITVDNAHAAKPFGTLDTPAQGGTASGNAYVNFGWALTQNPNCIPTDGSTITVVVDGVTLGHPVYNQPRSDIQSFFPGLCNTNGAVGFFYMDTTQLTNGVHTISWVAYDNVGHGDGLGSRYFTVANSGGGNAPAADEPIEAPSGSPTPSTAEIEQLGLLELHLGAARGHMLVGRETAPLPVGSTLKGGVFYWQAGLGFLGDYQLVFERSDGSEIPVHVKVRAKRFSDQ